MRQHAGGAQSGTMERSPSEWQPGAVPAILIERG